ncbi:MAG: PQQ-binding-like beta-propeller repeat protein [Candidatus Binatia bacterium]
MWAFAAATGLLKWVAPTFGPILGSPGVANGVVFVGSLSPDPLGIGNLFAFDAANGAELWRYTIDEPASSSPAIANGRVYVGTNETSATGALYAFAVPVPGVP